MARIGHILLRLGIITALTVVVGFHSAFARAGVGSVISTEPGVTAGAFNSITFHPDAIPGASLYEVCFFDAVETDIISCVALNPDEKGGLAENPKGLIKGRHYGCYIKAYFYQSGETTYSDTLFLTWEGLSHDQVITHGALKALGGDNSAGVQGVTRAHNYPNPFNPKEEDTRIVFQSDGGQSITILIYDLFGQLVYEKTHVDASNLRWEGRNGRGELVGSGGYICVLKIGGTKVSQHKIAVIK